MGHREIEVEEFKSDKGLGYTRNQPHQNEYSLFILNGMSILYLSFSLFFDIQSIMIISNQFKALPSVLES